MSINVAGIFGIFNLIMRTLQVVAAVEASLPGAKGAQKSEAVIRKVEPVAAALGAQQENVQAIIDTGVSLFNALGVFRKGTRPDGTHPDDDTPAAGSGGTPAEAP